MSRRDSVTQKDNSVTSKGKPGRTPTKAAAEASSLAKARSLLPSTSESPRAARLWQHAPEQVTSKSTSNQTRGKSFGDKGITQNLSSKGSSNSRHEGQSSGSTPIVSQFGPARKDSTQFDQRHKSKSPTNRVNLHQSDRKSAVHETPEKKVVSNPRISRDSNRDDYKGVWLSQSSKGLCRQCKSSMLESVCFITNDGHIAAVRTGDSVRHMHVCDSPRCAANPIYKPFLARTVLAGQRLPLSSKVAKDNFRAPSRLGIRSAPSSTSASVHGDDSPRHCAAVPEITKNGKDGAGKPSLGGTSALVQNRPNKDDGKMESHIGTSVGDQNFDNSCGFFNGEDDPFPTFVREFEDERRGEAGHMPSGNECCTPAHENSASSTDSCNRKTSGYEDHVLETECCKPASKKDGASSCFLRDFEDERISCAEINAGFGSECTTPLSARGNSSSLGSSQDHQERCRDEDGDIESCCSTPLGCNDGHSGKRELILHHGDDELSCTDDDRDGPVKGNAVSTLRTSPGNHDLSNSNEQATNKLQRKGSRVSRMRRNYLNMLKQQEAETVRLRKQEIQERKQAGEWMLDCAIEELLHKLAPDGETGVKVLVEAYETIMSHSDSETQHHEV